MSDGPRMDWYDSRSLKLSDNSERGGYSLISWRTKNSQLKRQKSVEIHLSLTLMQVKLGFWSF